MKVYLLFPTLPPALDGIGDHTVHLARALAGRGVEAGILTACGSVDSVEGVSLWPCFSLEGRPGLSPLIGVLREVRPDWLVVQYNPFSWGRWGLALSLAATLRAVTRQVPGLRVALMVHETFVPVISWKFAVMTTWQRYQLWQLGRLASVLLFSTQPWAERFARWFPGTPCYHLPVGSNVPDSGAGRAVARRELGLEDGVVVLGVFGTAHPSRLLGYVHRAAARLRREGVDAVTLYVGPHGSQVRAALPGLPLVDAGRQAPEGVSRCFRAMDVYLAPYSDGVSTRRGGFMAGLQHGVATVSTVGPLTDPMLREVAGEAFLAPPVWAAEAFTASVLELAGNPRLREAVGARGRTLFETHFTWDRLAARLLGILSLHGDAAVPGPGRVRA